MWTVAILKCFDNFMSVENEICFLLFVLWKAEEKASKVLGVKLEMKVNMYSALINCFSINEGYCFYISPIYYYMLQNICDITKKQTKRI